MNDSFIVGDNNDNNLDILYAVVRTFALLITFTALSTPTNFKTSTATTAIFHLICCISFYRMYLSFS